MRDLLTEPTVVAVDVDQTVADLHNEWLRRYNERSGDTLLPEDLDRWEIAEQIKPEWKDSFYTILGESDLYRHVAPMQGARQAIRRLKKAGCKVFFASSCSNGTELHKIAWLTRYGFIESRREFVSAQDKSLIHADYLIDDGPHNIAAFKGTGILLHQPHNSFVVVANRAMTIAEAADGIITDYWLKTL